MGPDNDGQVWFYENPSAYGLRFIWRHRLTATKKLLHAADTHVTGMHALRDTLSHYFNEWWSTQRTKAGNRSSPTVCNSSQVMSTTGASNTGPTLSNEALSFRTAFWHPATDFRAFHSDFVFMTFSTTSLPAQYYSFYLIINITLFSFPECLFAKFIQYFFFNFQSGEYKC